MKLSSSLAASAILLAAAPWVHASPPLPALGADQNATSVSGLSSGAFMAVQYQVAYSNSVVGAGVVAGGPYYCAANGFLAYAAICMGQVPFVPPNPALMASAARSFADAGQIDPLTGLNKARIYVFSGTRDTVVYQQAVNATVSFFKQVGVDKSNVQYVNNVPAGHALLTPSFGNPCADNAAPYISHCTVQQQAYDQAGAIFNHIYGNARPPASNLSGQIIKFNQREFAKADSGMAEDAFAYVPKACSGSGNACKVHVAFHGCLQSAESVQDDFYGKTSYNAWADTNNIIVLYPQVNKSDIPFNPNGCWDWFGYTDSNYALKSGQQMVAVNAMVKRLTAAPTSVQAAAVTDGVSR
ncbi:extracellular catalytic domain type 2 short-chain-length polyhydroxyalkanoate depolymerase [Pseudoduganella violacea]|uniref:Poly(3-hydroxybutyrate) depolymerase n=1 Tax=Pseudoduganella violacea TaxID=1715466 RepID=A0A7W5FVC3_9BURK|nr:PHB depolymerase family esterase [Pseudoduganella violacea]MBB3120637.1 poly(3-hydroxybutyrate) depolymerase [Pseudoduganella violacea]